MITQLYQLVNKVIQQIMTIMYWIMLVLVIILYEPLILMVIQGLVTDEWVIPCPECFRHEIAQKE